MYGLTYLYRASDFFGVVETFQPESVLFTAYWCRLWTGGLTEDLSRSDKWRMVDCYEFAFMGAFGMGYKLIVLGSMRVKLGLDGYPEEFSNRELWGVAEIVKKHALDVWRRLREKTSWPSNQARSRDFIIRPGFLCRLEPVETAFVDIDTFLKDKVPEKVPVVCPVAGVMSIGKGMEGSE